MPKNNLSIDTLLGAIEALDLQRRQIDARIDELRAATAGARSTAAQQQPSTPRKRRPMSAAARKRIAAAQKKRWDEYHRQHQTQSAEPAKRRMSAAGRQAIAKGQADRRNKERAMAAGG